MLHSLMFMNLTIHDSKFKLSDMQYDSRFNYHEGEACTLMYIL